MSGDLQAAICRIDKQLHAVQDIHRVVTRVSGRPVIHTQLQLLFNLKFPNQVDKRVYELIMTHATTVEKIGPGGFSTFLGQLHHLLGGSTVGTDSILPRHATASDVRRIVDQFSETGGDRTAAMLWQALELAGFGGRIIVEKTTSSVPSVELVRGYTFELQQFLPIDFNFLRPRITCIDGYIESVSEIHHLLEAASSAKEPCILFVRGLSEDVKHTLKVNYDRGSLRVIPIGVRFDLDGMNTLVDLSTITSADLISSLKGDLISSIKFEELPSVDQLTMFKGKVVVTTSRNARSVKAHVQNLKARRASEETIDDVGKLLDKRIKSLSPNHVVIRLPDDKDFVVNSQSIDYALRAVKSAVDHGIAANGNLAATEMSSRHHARKCLETLKDLGGVVG